MGREVSGRFGVRDKQAWQFLEELSTEGQRKLEEVCEEADGGERMLEWLKGKLEEWKRIGIKA